MELHPELKQRLFESFGGFPYISHPLVTGIFLEGLAENYNQQLLSKRSYLQKCFDTKNWNQYVFTHERPYRLNAFVEIQKHLTDTEYWKLLGRIWSDSENIWQEKSAWKRCLKSKRQGREFFMSERDRNFLKSLPDELTIYRGYTKGCNRDGFSYTLSRDKAVWFSNRFQNKKLKAGLITRVVRKEDVFAYIDSRNEKEIIILL